MSQVLHHNAYIKQEAKAQFELAVQDLKGRNQAKVDAARHAYEEAHKQWMQVGP